MSAAIHLTLVVVTLAGALGAWLLVGLTLADVASGAAAVIGLLLYLRPFEIFEAAPTETGGHDVR